MMYLNDYSKELSLCAEILKLSPPGLHRFTFNPSPHSSLRLALRYIVRWVVVELGVVVRTWRADDVCVCVCVFGNALRGVAVALVGGTLLAKRQDNLALEQVVHRNRSETS